MLTSWIDSSEALTKACYEMVFSVVMVSELGDVLNNGMC